MLAPLNETKLDELKRYVRFGHADVALLRAFHTVAAPHFERIAQEFYERTREHEEAHAVFTGEEQIARLQRSLVRWMHRVCTGDRDAAYFDETAKIGRVHVNVGLPQRYVFTAMALIRAEFERIVDREVTVEPTATRISVGKALDLELAIMLETYQEDVVARLRRVEELERADLGRALARSEHRYVNAVELAPYLVVALDENGRVLLFNREAENVTGWGRDEALGRPFVDVFTPEELRDEQRAKIDAAMHGAQNARNSMESVVQTKSGKLRMLRWEIARTVAADASDDVAAFAIGRDVTDEKALAERTRQTEKLAAVGTLAAGLAHEIRNPLNGAHLHVTFLERALKKSSADEESLEAVRVVGDEVKRLSQLVDEFLDFARPKPLERKPISLQTACSRVVQLVASQAATANVQLEMELPASPLEIEADGAKLEQVLLNLTQNAIEALAPIGGGRVVLRARRQPLRAVIEVEDDGPGIPEGNAPIFDAFYSTKPSGTGLGLAIVHRIVTDHGGTIGCESKPGRTIFRATFPITVGSG